jgi:hypothetical protein
MNCNRCKAELPDGATFCPRCGNPTGGKPIFPAIPQDQQPTGQYTLLIGCACVLGAALMFASIVGIASFNMYIHKQASVRANSERNKIIPETGTEKLFEEENRASDE